jgi:hypothetical protein
MDGPLIEAPLVDAPLVDAPVSGAPPVEAPRLETPGVELLSPAGIRMILVNTQAQRMASGIFFFARDLGQSGLRS